MSNRSRHSGHSFSIVRIGGTLGLDTHETSYWTAAIQALYREARPLRRPPAPLKICDPFARNCLLAHPHTNDIDPNTKAVHHDDAASYLAGQDTSSFDAVIFDPPFSPNQATRYEYGTTNIYTTPGAVPRLMKEIERILRPGGLLLKFGFNTTRHKGHFDLVHVIIVNHGGNHNDTLVSLWRKASHNLEEWT